MHETSHYICRGSIFARLYSRLPTLAQSRARRSRARVSHAGVDGVPASTRGRRNAVYVDCAKNRSDGAVERKLGTRAADVGCSFSSEGRCIAAEVRGVPMCTGVVVSDGSVCVQVAAALHKNQGGGSVKGTKKVRDMCIRRARRQLVATLGMQRQRHRPSESLDLLAAQVVPRRSALLQPWLLAIVSCAHTI